MHKRQADALGGRPNNTVPDMPLHPSPFTAWRPAFRAALLAALGAPLLGTATAATITPSWETLNAAQPRGAAVIAWDIWWGSGSYDKACYQLANQPLGCVARTGTTASPLALDANGNGLGSTPGQATKGLFRIPAAKTPSSDSAPVTLSLYGASGSLVESKSFTMTFTTPAPASPAPQTPQTPAPVSASPDLIPDWNTLNAAQPRRAATIAWDIWWGSADASKACYRIANQDAGCVPRTGATASPLALDAAGNGLAVIAGQASKGLFRLPEKLLPAASSATASVTLYNAANAAVASKTFTIKFESSPASAGTIATPTPPATSSVSSGGGASGSTPSSNSGGHAAPSGNAGGASTTASGPTLTAAELAATEARLTSSPVIASIKRAIATLPNDAVEAVVPARAANPANVRRVERLLTSANWDYLFPLRAKEYTYTGFLRAIAKFPAVCRDYGDGRDADAICRKTMATMFAHFAQETGGHESWRPEAEWRQALVWVREMGWSEGQRGGYNAECAPSTWQGKTWPCGQFGDGTFKSYFGRGAKQLSYNYNYGPFSMAMYGSVRPLLDKPELVADTWLNLASAVFFYMYPQPPKPPMMFVVDGTWQPNARDLANGLKPGFGVTTQIINGGVECGGSVEVAQSLNRISYYKSFASYFGIAVPADEVLGCKGMKQFDEGGAGATPIYWERDDGWYADRPGGKSYACKLVGYQTPHSALVAGDYAACVKAQFPDVSITR